MSKTTKSVRYGVGAATQYSEEDPYISYIRTPQEALAELQDLKQMFPTTKFRVFKQERVEVVTDVTDELV